MSFLKKKERLQYERPRPKTKQELLAEELEATRKKLEELKAKSGITEDDEDQDQEVEVLVLDAAKAVPLIENDRDVLHGADPEEAWPDEETRSSTMVHAAPDNRPKVHTLLANHNIVFDGACYKHDTELRDKIKLSELNGQEATALSAYDPNEASRAKQRLHTPFPKVIRAYGESDLHRTKLHFHLGSSVLTGDDLYRLCKASCEDAHAEYDWDPDKTEKKTPKRCGIVIPLEFATLFRVLVSDPDAFVPDFGEAYNCLPVLARVIDAINTTNVPFEVRLQAVDPETGKCVDISSAIGLSSSSRAAVCTIPPQHHGKLPEELDVIYKMSGKQQRLFNSPEMRRFEQINTRELLNEGIKNHRTRDDSNMLAFERIKEDHPVIEDMAAHAAYAYAPVIYRAADKVDVKILVGHDKSGQGETVVVPVEAFQVGVLSAAQHFHPKNAGMVNAYGLQLQLTPVGSAEELKEGDGPQLVGANVELLWAHIPTAHRADPKKIRKAQDAVEYHRQRLKEVRYGY